MRPQDYIQYFQQNPNRYFILPDQTITIQQGRMTCTFASLEGVARFQDVISFYHSVPCASGSHGSADRVGVA